MFQEIHLDSVPFDLSDCHPPEDVPRRVFPIHLHLIKDLGYDNVTHRNFHGCDVEVSTFVASLCQQQALQRPASTNLIQATSQTYGY